MGGFYCVECGDILDDPDEETCMFCRENEDAYCDQCGSVLPAGDSEDGLCDECQETLDVDILDEDDEEFLKGPFR